MSGAVAERMKRSDNWQALRQQAADRFDLAGFPTKGEEAWKYTSLRHIPAEQLAHVSEVGGAATARKPWGETQRLVLVNGHVDEAQSRLPERVTLEICDLNAPTDAQQAFFAERLSGDSRFEQAGHVSLNRARADRALLLKVTSPQEGSEAPVSLEIHHILTEEAAQQSSYTQLWLDIEKGAELTLVERFYSDMPDALSHFQHHLVNLALESGASVNHIRCQTLPAEVIHLYTAQLLMQGGSRYNSFSLMAGAGLARQEVQTHLLQEGAHCDIQGVVLGRDTQHFDSYLPVYHDAPGCFSNQHFRQLLDDASSGVYYGRAEVPTTSPRTEAHQLNKNLLLSDEAQVFTRPELDILTDEVVCSHGATTGSLDEQALYYLQARGIPFAQARNLLTRGFIEALVQQVQPDAVREGLMQLLRQEMEAS